MKAMIHFRTISNVLQANLTMKRRIRRTTHRWHNCQACRVIARTGDRWRANALATTHLFATRAPIANGTIIDSGALVCNMLQAIIAMKLRPHHWHAIHVVTARTKLSVVVIVIVVIVLGGSVVVMVMTGARITNVPITFTTTDHGQTRALGTTTDITLMVVGRLAAFVMIGTSHGNGRRSRRR